MEIMKNVGRLLGMSLLALTLSSGCHYGHEGERCNPSLPPDQSDCNAGLTCQTPSTCVESYCCPEPASMSANGFCNGQFCPAVDAGADGG